MTQEGGKKLVREKNYYQENKKVVLELLQIYIALPAAAVTEKKFCWDQVFENLGKWEKKYGKVRGSETLSSLTSRYDAGPLIRDIRIRSV